MRCLSRFTAFGLSGFAWLLCVAHGAVEARMDEKYRAFFQETCVECHNADKQKGNLRLDDISFALNTVENAERWQKILNQINAGEMPPEDAKQPERNTKAEFLDALSNALVSARKALADQHGKVTMRRLNRREYQNTIRDLLGVSVDARDLPTDGSAQSFDTVGASLFMSSDQIEQYLVLGRRVLEERFARVGPRASGADRRPFKKHIETEVGANKEMTGLVERLKKDYGRYLQWVAAVDAEAAKPEHAELVKELREIPQVKNNADQFYVHWAKRRTTPSPKQFGYAEADLALFFGKTTFDRLYRYSSEYLELPDKDSGSYLLTYQGHEFEKISADAAWPPGLYTLRVRLAALDDAPPERRFIQVGQHGENIAIFSLLGTHQVTGTQDAPQILEIPLTISSADNREFVLREKQPSDRSAQGGAWSEAFNKSGTGPRPALWIDWMEIEGPAGEPVSNDALASDFHGAGRAVLARALAGDLSRDAARELLADFAGLAFRDQKPSPAYLDKLMRVFEEKKHGGSTVEEALREALSVILASPGFLYLHEPAGDTAPRLLTQRELAVRLAYFLWSAPPDARLLERASRGELSKPEVLKAEVDRLLADARAYEFVTGLTRQWLDMDRLDFFQFNAKKFRTFDESTKSAAKEEVTRTVEWILKENLSVAALLKSDFVVVNGLLASFYGIEGVAGDSFRKVSVDPSSPRGGLLGMAAILAMGSNGEQTSPVERGAWVLRKLLNDPPPPAPKGVPQLTRLEGKLLTTRERLTAHQEQPQCAQCHRKIDPIGFGLENFDAVGLWRTHDVYERRGVGKKEWEIDPAGTLHNGPAFSGYFELRDRIAEKPERFARGFAEALLQYGLGRQVGFSDEVLLEQLMHDASQKNFAMREFILSLVQSRVFQSK